jgi:hypothetical protein
MHIIGSPPLHPPPSPFPPDAPAPPAGLQRAKEQGPIASTQRLVAYHEAGHAVMALLTPEFDSVTKVRCLFLYHHLTPHARNHKQRPVETIRSCVFGANRLHALGCLSLPRLFCCLP